MSREPEPRSIRLEDYRAPDYWIDRTELVVDLQPDHALVTSTLSVRRNKDQGEDTPDLVLHGEDLQLVSLVRDGELLHDGDFAASEGRLTVPVKSALFTLTSVTRIFPDKNSSLEGLYRSNGMYCTQCEAEGFRKITYYLDRPDVMSVFTTKVIADKTVCPVLLSNGNRVGSGDLDNGRHWVEWHDPFKKPSYLFALVAGDLQRVRDRFVTCSDRTVTLEIYTEAHNIDRCDHAMRSLKKAMRWDEKTYGREYDLDLFMIVAVDHFNMGAMENKGLNIFNSACVLATPDTTTDLSYQRIEGVVAHEYFHNWSGNRVTCRDWFQLSLKEGFTVFRDAEFSADMNSHGVKRIEDATLVKNQQFAEDAGPMAHPVRPPAFIEISNFYTLTVYEKGAEVVRMIRTLIGAEAFRKGSDLYFERHDGQAVTCEDFVRTMEEASGMDLTQFRRWYDQAGTPVLDVTDHFDEEKNEYRLTVRQSCPPTPETADKKPFHIPLALALFNRGGEPVQLDDNGEFEKTVSVTQEEQSWTFGNVHSKPVPSLLRHFSAPVRVNFNYSDVDLCLLAKHDSDAFNRWDAVQRLATRVIFHQMDNTVSGSEPALLDALKTVLMDGALDRAVKAKIMLLPSEESLAEQSEVIKPLRIHEVRERMRVSVAQVCAESMFALYQTLDSDADYQPVAEDVARRALRNICLGYLSLLDDERLKPLAVNQFHSANNMTDRMAALAAVVNSESHDRSLAAELLETFRERYQDDSLVMDSWFQIQSSSPILGTLGRIRTLSEHAAFDRSNPNRLRALLGGFCRNFRQFHQLEQPGYDFLADWIIELDRSNPQIASRLMAPLVRWKRYESTCQQRMHSALERIAGAGQLSRDVYEVVTKSLQ